MRSTRRTTRQRRGHLANRAGFTLVEVILVVTLTTLGFVALFELQATGLKGMRAASHMSKATTLAENFIERLRFEFSSWTQTQPLSEASQPSLEGLPINNFSIAGAQTPGGEVAGGTGWVIGDTEGGADRRVGSQGDAHALGLNQGIAGAVVEDWAAAGNQDFCLLYRLTWLVPNRAIRVEVEVSWPSANANMEEFVTCSTNAVNQLHQVRSVTMTSTLMVNLFRR